MSLARSKVANIDMNVTTKEIARTFSKNAVLCKGEKLQLLQP